MVRVVINVVNLIFCIAKLVFECLSLLITALKWTIISAKNKVQTLPQPWFPVLLPFLAQHPLAVTSATYSAT